MIRAVTRHSSVVLLHYRQGALDSVGKVFCNHRRRYLTNGTKTSCAVLRLTSGRRTTVSRVGVIINACIATGFQTQELRVNLFIIFWPHIEPFVNHIPVTYATYTPTG